MTKKQLVKKLNDCYENYIAEVINDKIYLWEIETKSSNHVHYQGTFSCDQAIELLRLWCVEI